MNLYYDLSFFFAMIEGFSYHAKHNAEILILGSMPGIASLDANEYYAHKQNIFWDIIEDLFSISRQLAYQERLEQLITKRVALWDVAYQCERQGSLDSNIVHSSLVCNDFNAFFEKHQDIKVVFFNGQKAFDLYRTKVLKQLEGNFQHIPRVKLPSTSPANASVKKAKKFESWQAIKII